MVVSMNLSNIWPKDSIELFEFTGESAGVELLCFFEHLPDENISFEDSSVYEPLGPQHIKLVAAFTLDSDTNIAHLLLQHVVDDITTQAMKDL